MQHLPGVRGCWASRKALSNAVKMARAGAGGQGRGAVGKDAGDQENTEQGQRGVGLGGAVTSAGLGSRGSAQEQQLSWGPGRACVAPTALR